MEDTQVIASSAGQWFGRASIKSLDSGILVMMYKEGSAHAENDGELHIRFSGDYGQSWTAEDNNMASGSVTGFPMNPPAIANMDSGEPWLYLLPNGNLAVHMWNVDYGVSVSGTWQSLSSDDGDSWSTPASLVNFSGISGSNYHVLATDDNFVVSGTVYAGARIHDETGSPIDSVFIKSEDNGSSWEVVSVIMANTEGDGGTGASEVGLHYIGDNTILAMLRDEAHINSYKRISTDFGQTWGDLISMNNRNVGIAGRQRVYSRAYLKGQSEWWNDDVLFMVGFDHQNSGESHPRRNCIWISLDRGDTWSSPFWLDVPYNDAGYGDIFYDSNNDQYGIVTYRGTLAEADLVQYKISIEGLP